MTEKVLIIAEAGVNHNGDINIAKSLIDAAADAGADYVKFQTFKAVNIASRLAAKAEYQVQTTDVSEGQLAMLQKLELDRKDHLELIDHCKKRNIQFLSTPFDMESIDLLTELGVTLGKIPSGEITNLPYLRKMADSFSQLILSTGMSEMEEIEKAMGVITRGGFDKSNLVALHCNTEYPTPFSDVNLRAMKTIESALGVRVGYSDHTPGIEVPIAATALGACIIEKHFTLDRGMQGPDHKASLEPGELKAMVRAIRNIEQALGSSQKKPTASEIKNRDVARKSIVAARCLPAGHVIEYDDLAIKRPGNGISPMDIYSIIGKRLLKDLNEDDQLSQDYFA